MSLFFFFNDTATTEIYTLSLHDALPICGEGEVLGRDGVAVRSHARAARADVAHLATAVLGVEVGLELQRIEVVLARGKSRHARLHPLFEAGAFGLVPGAGRVLSGFGHVSLHQRRWIMAGKAPFVLSMNHSSW